MTWEIDNGYRRGDASSSEEGTEWARFGVVIVERI
jgi:hypothetical protein